MAYLYKHTALQESFPVNLTCLVPVYDEDGKERTPQARRLGLKEMLRYFLDFRLATVRRRFEFELEQLRRRIHILDGFRIIFNALDEAIKIIRQSSGKADASEKLREAFDLDEEQAGAVLDAQLYKIAHLEIKKILDELKEKRRKRRALRRFWRRKRSCGAW
jgi:DNA gyrase subunit A